VRAVFFGANLIFILSSAAALFSKSLRKRWSLSAFHWLLAGCVWGASAVSSILEQGNNPRYLVPLQTAAAFWVLWVVWTTWQAVRAARRDNHKIKQG
jgi:hypothetical protein